jgi:hypothetical protein
MGNRFMHDNDSAYQFLIQWTLECICEDRSREVLSGTTPSQSSDPDRYDLIWNEIVNQAIGQLNERGKTLKSVTKMSYESVRGGYI